VGGEQGVSAEIWRCQ